MADAQQISEAQQIMNRLADQVQIGTQAPRELERLMEFQKVGQYEPTQFMTGLTAKIFGLAKDININKIVIHIYTYTY